MKTVLVLAVVVCAILVVADAKKRKCRYERKSKWSICTNGAQTKTVKLKVGSANCAPEKTRTRSCGAAPSLLKEKCKFEKGDWSECNVTTNMQSRIMTLVNGKASCPPTKTKTRKCKQGCRYQKGSWTACSVAGRMTRVLALVEGGDHCKPSKTRERKCKKAKMGYNACLYRRVPWSQCDPTTNKMTRTMTLIPGSRHGCKLIKSVTRRCRHRSALTAARFKLSCKYELQKTSNCNLRTNTVTKTLTLVKGDPHSCVPVKEFKRKCRKPCKFRKGSWSTCNMKTHLMIRKDVLVKGDAKYCSKNREITKKCKKGKKKCQYGVGEWSKCDALTNKRSRIKTLKKGDPSKCQAEKTITKACSRPNGKERCFFSQWGEYGKCMNGVMTKAREVIQGGTECERKAVKTKACS